MHRYVILCAASAAIAIPSEANAQQFYGSLSAGLNIQKDSNNHGQLTSTFVTGNGSPAVPTGTSLPSGTSLGWRTKFDNGPAFSGEVGARFGGGFRAGVEITYTKARVKTHRGVTVGGTNIDAVDAAVLTGSPTKLNATVGQVVDSSNGSIKNLGIFGNVYFDVPTGSPISPYVGAGIGLSDVKVRYQPSAVNIVDDSKTKFAYQLMAGVSAKVSPQVELFGQYTYRATGDAKVRVNLVPAQLSVENKQSLITAGVRISFGGVAAPPAPPPPPPPPPPPAPATKSCPDGSVIDATATCPAPPPPPPPPPPATKGERG